MPATKNHIIFVQNRAQRAGAQVSLSRIVTSHNLRTLNPFVLLGVGGWLESFLTEQSIPHQVTPWPSPRSLAARVGGLSQYARRTVRTLHLQGIIPRAIIANDHQECLTALALSKAAGGVPVIAIFRSANMSQNDYTKYNGDQCSALFARGKELTAKVHNWSQRDVTCMIGSFTDEDLHDPVPSPEAFPTKILIAGSEAPGKGFADFIEALTIVEEKEPQFPPLECHFTGLEPKSLKDLNTAHLRSNFHFEGRIENFTSYARPFNLAIHPSRAETFGMAPLELILAGIPTMVSETGVAPSLSLPNPWSFPPSSPALLADAIIGVWRNWPSSIPDIRHIQKKILDSFSITTTTNSLAQTIIGLTK